VKHIRIAPRLLAAAVLAAAVAACDDISSVAGVNGDCPELEQTEAQAAQGVAEGMARVRVNLVSRLGVDAGSGEGLSTSGVNLYRGADCVRIASTQLTRLGTVENSMGGAVADAAVEPGQITHVLLLQDAPAQGARRVRAEKIALSQPVTLEAGTRTEIFLALDPIAGSQDAAVRFIAAGPVQLDAGAVMVFEPGRGASASMRRGFTLDMPDGSVSQPTVYGIVENDVGGVASMFNVMPQSVLDGSARITFPVNRARIAQGLAMSDYGARLGGASAASTVTGNTVSMDIGRLGVVSMGTDRLWSQTDDGTIRATPAAAASPAREATMGLVNNTCSQRLAANRSTHFSRMTSNAGLLISDCTDVPPYVHIILLNLSYTINSGLLRPRLIIPATWYEGTNTFVLKTITEQANSVGAFAAVNGFQWTGDDGSSDGTGVARGTLYINGVRKSPAYSGGEAILGFTGQSSNATYGSLFIKPSGGTVSLGSYSWNAVPTTTSIIRNGVCSPSDPGGETTRYSAMGIGQGLLALVSSVSDYNTTPYQLCSVFEGLNMLGGAILLDGSSAAGMYWLGSHLNPVTGTSSWYWGSARHIAYGVGAIK
jgi:hypothetical protein